MKATTKELSRQRRTFSLRASDTVVSCFSFNCCFSSSEGNGLASPLHQRPPLADPTRTQSVFHEYPTAIPIRRRTRMGQSLVPNPAHSLLCWNPDHCCSMHCKCTAMPSPPRTSLRDTAIKSFSSELPCCAVSITLSRELRYGSVSKGLHTASGTEWQSPLQTIEGLYRDMLHSEYIERALATHHVKLVSLTNEW